MRQGEDDEVQTFALSHSEAVALRIALTGHDMDLESGACECGHHVDPHNTDDRTEHLLEASFRAGELHALNLS